MNAELSPLVLVVAHISCNPVSLKPLEDPLQPPIFNAAPKDQNRVKLYYFLAFTAREISSKTFIWLEVCEMLNGVSPSSFRASSRIAA